MKPVHVCGLCAASILALSMAAFAQATPQERSTAPAGAREQTTGDQQVTVSGCIQRESDYRRARDAGRGGVVGTGVGAGNEFVLANATMASAGAGAPAATAGTSGTTMAYELTGTNEGQAAQHVGKRVEIAGKLKAAEVSAGRPTGGATAGKPPEGIDVGGQDLKLRELEITSIKEVSGTCPAQ